jgi:hypothetical protein
MFSGHCKPNMDMISRRFKRAAIVAGVGPTSAIRTNSGKNRFVPNQHKKLASGLFLPAFWKKRPKPRRKT